jgi:putative intracellular protease/amidase
MKHLFCLAFFALDLLGCNRPGSSAVPLTSSRLPPVLLFNGTGTSPNDVAAIETLLEKSRISYSTARSAQLDEMSAARLRAYHLIIVPGGDFTRIGNGLTKETVAKLRDAVQHGVNYLGICAGAFFAGHSPYNGLNLTPGVQFGFYSAEAREVRKTAVMISGAGTPTLEQYWEDGPQLTGWGVVVGRYPDGTPAVVQGQSGEGWIILIGIHPEAPESWRGGMDFTTPASVDHAYAVTLVRAALERRPLPHF